MCNGYISAGGQLAYYSLLGQHGNDQLFSFFCVGFTVIFAAIITWKTLAVDYVNRILFSLKIVFLMCSIFFLFGHVNLDYVNSPLHQPKYVWSTIPVVFTAFGFHGSIPSVVHYIGKDRARLRRIIFVGASIPMVIYLMWLVATLLTLPLCGATSFDHVLKSKDAVSMLISDVSEFSGMSAISFAASQGEAAGRGRVVRSS